MLSHHDTATLAADLGSARTRDTWVSGLTMVGVAMFQVMLMVRLAAVAPGHVVAGWVVSIVAVALLAGRRRWPEVVLFAELAVSWTGGFLGVPASYVVVPSFVAAYAVVSRSRLVPLLFCLGVMTASLVARDRVDTGIPGAMSSLVPSLLLLVVTIAAALTIRLRRENLKHAQDAAQARAEEVRLGRERDAAQTRARLVGELHDSVGHNLTAIIALTEGMSGAGSDDAVGLINELAREGLRDTRSLLAALEDTPTFVPPQGARDWAELPELLRRVRATGVQVTISETGTRPPRDDLGVVVYSVIRESLTNALRHAPTTHRISILLDHRSAGSRLQVTNFVPEGQHPSAIGVPGTGLEHLRRQVETFGGTLEAGPIPDGWRVAALISHHGSAS